MPYLQYHDAGILFKSYLPYHHAVSSISRPWEIGLLCIMDIGWPKMEYRSRLPGEPSLDHPGVPTGRLGHRGGGSENGRRHFPAIFLWIASPPRRVLGSSNFDLSNVYAFFRCIECMHTINPNFYRNKEEICWGMGYVSQAAASWIRKCTLIPQVCRGT